MIDVLFTRLDERAWTPTQGHPDEDAGWDLVTLEDVDVDTTLHGGYPNATWTRTGIAVAIPRGYYGRICGRSSTASRGFYVIEGIIDSGYRGELLVRVVPVWNPSTVGLVRHLQESQPERTPPVSIHAGTALAQLIIAPVPDVDMIEVEGLPESQRGENGFGSSDKFFKPEAAPKIRVGSILRDAALSQHPDLQNVDPELADWWLRLAVSDSVATMPKAMEYGGAVTDGSADLRVMGYALAELAGMHDAPEAVKLEMACWFYALGKIARLISDYKAGRSGKSDTWMDLGVYTVMARRIQETGRWP